MDYWAGDAEAAAERAKTARIMETQLEVRVRMELLDALLAHARRCEILGWYRASEEIFQSVGFAQSI